MKKLKNDDSVRKIKELLPKVLSTTSRTTKLVEEIEEIIKCQDVLYYTWKELVKLISTNNDSSDTFMLNALDLLEKISITKHAYSTKEKEATHDESFGLNKGVKKFILDMAMLKKYERKVWRSIINRNFSLIVHRKLLLVLVELYLSKMDNPIFLTDFLMASMNVKGVIRILALQGVATLIQKHNIEYPNIYEKLYEMFEPNIFHSKYKSRLFYLANIFLSSTHLPEIIVASFAKRSSRLALSCATPDVLIILRFVENLILRHIALKKMIHYPTDHKVSEDPFLMNEKDPMKTRATESSLWEFFLLNNHCQPSISSAANFIHFNLPTVEMDLSEVLTNSYEEMFEKECKKKKIQPTLTFERPHDTVAKLKDDMVFKMWSLT